MTDSLADGSKTLDYRDIPHFPQTHVDGHPGRLAIREMRGVAVAVFAGRPHIYEGYAQRDVAFPVYVARRLGAVVMILTNAAGAVNQDLEPGNVMVITDHINLSGGNPLSGDAGGAPFVDMRDAYDVALRATAKNVAARGGIALREGVYAMLQGPSYETAAEVGMLRAIGADAVGMSTVPEVIAARHAGMRVLALSVIANAAGDTAAETPRLTHDEVLRVVRLAAGDARTVIEGVVESLRP